MQDQAFLGPESGLAVPAEDGGVDLYVATQWLHVDRDQVAACLGLPPEKVRLDPRPASAGRSAAARTCRCRSTPACWRCTPARPVKMVYGREESFFGHVAPPPGAGCATSTGPTRDGRLVYVKARIVLDGGAYASSSPARGRQRGVAWRSGPTPCRTCAIDAYGVYTNNPPCGAMRGFGAVQTCFAHEAQMDKLAAALGAGPGRAAAAQRDDARARSMPTGQVVVGPAPVAEPAALGPRRAPAADRRGPARCAPAASRNTTRGEGVVRGVGFAVGFKNVGFSEGFDDYSTARVRLAARRR